MSLKNKSLIGYKLGQYEVTDGTTYINDKGRALSMWYFGKTNPLKVEPNKTLWIDSQTLKNIIQNEQVRKIVTPKNSSMDMLLMIGSICAIVGALAGILIALNQFGVINP